MRARLNLPTSAAARKYDVIVWGATGFTGQLVAEYLAAHYNQGGEVVKWAIGGRSAKKLAAVVAALDGVAKPDMIIADSGDLASLQALAKQTTVVITTVGPYFEYGAPLVEACVGCGTHYVDLTGEPPFCRAMIDAHHEAAVASGSKIVHCCGFDSIPSDLGTLLLVEHMKKSGAQCASVAFYMGAARGGASGGTLASALGIFALPKTELLQLRNPYYLNPKAPSDEPCAPAPASVDGFSVADRKGLWWDGAIRSWTMPFAMAIINTRVVRRSAALAKLVGRGYGDTFAYNECHTCPPGPFGALLGLLTSMFTPLFVVVAMFAPGRALLRWIFARVGLAPGQGPSRHMQRTGFFKVKLVGKDTAGRTHVASVQGTEDPGYSGTAKMLTEAALTLALQADELSYKSGGVLTPAIAMGMPLVERLRRKGMTFSVLASEKSKDQ